MKIKTVTKAYTDHYLTMSEYKLICKQLAWSRYLRRKISKWQLDNAFYAFEKMSIDFH